MGGFIHVLSSSLLRARANQGLRAGPATMATRFLALAGGASALLLVGAMLPGCRQEPGAAAGPPKKVPVKVARPQERSDVVEYEDVRGQTKACKSVDLLLPRQRLPEKILFKDGADVTEGQLLFEIDDGPFKAALDQAQADLEVKKANRKFREAELARNKSLPPGAISQSDLEKSRRPLDEAMAAVTAGRPP